MGCTKTSKNFVLYAPAYNGTYLVSFGILTRVIVQVYYWYMFVVNHTHNYDRLRLCCNFHAVVSESLHTYPGRKGAARSRPDRGYENQGAEHDQRDGQDLLRTPQIEERAGTPFGDGRVLAVESPADREQYQCT